MRLYQSWQEGALNSKQNCASQDDNFGGPVNRRALLKRDFYSYLFFDEGCKPYEGSPIPQIPPLLPGYGYLLEDWPKTTENDYDEVLLKLN
jgi:hypothetical protein